MKRKELAGDEDHYALTVHTGSRIGWSLVRQLNPRKHKLNSILFDTNGRVVVTLTAKGKRK